MYLTGQTSQLVTVAFDTADGTAEAGTDFTDTSGTLTFEPGVMSRTVTVGVNGESVNEPDESFVVLLSGVTNALLADTQADAQVGNDDASMFGTVGDWVWLDANADGIQGDDELGVAGVTVRLLEGNNVTTTVTDAKGKYQFGNLDPAKQYQVEFVLPGGYSFTQPGKGTDPAKNSDANQADGKSPVLAAIAAGKFNLDVDAGLVITSVGDFVWFDKNRNGIQDGAGDEVGMPGVTVLLLDQTGATVDSASTNYLGKYQFDGLDPSKQYNVQFVLPTGYYFSEAGQGADPALNSDVNPADGKSPVIPLVAGKLNPDIDAGLIRFAVGDKVWRDDGNGIQDPGEPGIPGVEVRLLDAVSGDVLASTKTDYKGEYLLDVASGKSYQVQFLLPVGYSFTASGVGGNALVDSDADQSNGKSLPFSVVPGTFWQDIDAGMRSSAVKGRMWWDDDADSIRNPLDLSVPGVTVRLIDQTGFVLTTKTDATGQYGFDGLDPDFQYQIQFVLPGGWQTNFVAKNAGTDSTLDSDANPADGKTEKFTLLTGTTTAVRRRLSIVLRIGRFRLVGQERGRHSRPR